MKAAVFHGPRKIQVENILETKPKRNEILVRFKAGSICGTDLHFYRSEWTDLTEFPKAIETAADPKQRPLKILITSRT